MAAVRLYRRRGPAGRHQQGNRDDDEAAKGKEVDAEV
jgi:hypothetical protein